MENKYPMNYEDYEKKVIELFLNTGSYATPNEKLTFLKEELLNNDPDFIKNLYKQSCYDYNHYSKDEFTDEKLLATPVNALEMLY